MAKQTRPSSTPIPIRFSERMLSDIEEVAESLQLSRQDVIRLSVAAGLKAMKRIGYDGIADAVASRVSKSDFESQAAAANKPEPSIIAFPEVPLLRAAAGTPILSDAEMVQPDRDLGTGRFLLELRGDSMEPRFQNRQRVVLRDKSTLRRPVLKYKEFYCFIHEGQACFKQWAKDGQGRKVLRSLNPEHPDIPADDQTEWIGWFDPADNA